MTAIADVWSRMVQACILGTAARDEKFATSNGSQSGNQIEIILSEIENQRDKFQSKEELMLARLAAVACRAFVTPACTGAAAAQIGTFALTAISETPADANDNGSLGWTFTLDDNDPVLQSLAKDQTITQIYTVTVTDNNGAPVTQDVTVTIIGANDGVLPPEPDR